MLQVNVTSIAVSISLVAASVVVVVVATSNNSSLLPLCARAIIILSSTGSADQAESRPQHSAHSTLCSIKLVVGPLTKTSSPGAHTLLSSGGESYDREGDAQKPCRSNVAKPNSGVSTCCSNVETLVSFRQPHFDKKRQMISRRPRTTTIPFRTRLRDVAGILEWLDRLRLNFDRVLLILRIDT